MQRSTIGSLRPVRRRVLPDVPALGGVIAGLMAGAVMVLLSPLLSLLMGVNLWVPPKLIGATMPWVDGVAATVPGFDLVPVLTGALLHFVMSALLGAMFGLFFRGLGLPSAFGLPVLIGLVYGIVIFVGAFFVALPLINPTLASSNPGPVVAQNVVFGVCLGLFYGMVRPRPYVEGGPNEMD